MNKDQLSTFLTKLKLNELRALAKKLSIKGERKDTKTQLIERIINRGEINNVLDQLGLNPSAPALKEKESLAIARKSLANQEEGLKNQKWQRNIAVLSLFVALCSIGLTIYLKKSDSSSEKEPDLPAEISPSSLFKNPSFYNILLLPFGSSQNCEDETIICEREVESRFNILKEQNHIPEIEVQVYQKINTTQRSLGFERARTLGDSLGADLIVWGDYQSKCEWDSTKIRVKWAATKTNIPFLDPIKDVEYLGVEDISQIEEGEITGNIEEIIFWSLARNEASKKNYEQALAYLGKIKIKEKKEYGLILKEIGFYHILLNDYSVDDKMNEEAYKFMLRSIELKPDDEEVYYNLASLLIYAPEKKDQRLAFLSKAIEVNPDFGPAYFARAITYRNLEEKEKSIADYTKYIELEPDLSKTSRAYNFRGILYSMLNMNKEALADYSKMIELKPEYAPAYYNRGYILQKLGKSKEALIDFTKAIELKLEDPRVYTDRGDIYFKLGKKKEALKDLTKAIELNTKDETVYVGRGAIYEDLKKNKEALSDFNKAIELNPDYALAYFYRGYTLGFMKKHKDAIVDFTKAIELKPDFGMAYEGRSLMYKVMGETQKSKEDKEQFEKLKVKATSEN